MQGTKLWFKTGSCVRSRDVCGRYNTNNHGDISEKQCKRKWCSWEDLGVRTEEEIILSWSSRNPSSDTTVTVRATLHKRMSRPKRLQDSDYFKDKIENSVTTLMINMGRFTQDDLDSMWNILIYDEARKSYDSNTPLESNSNTIPYDQYMEDNEDHVVQRDVSSVRNDALMSILDEMNEQDRNRKETSLKSELHSAQILLSSTVDHYKSKTEEVTLLKKDFKQKEDIYFLKIFGQMKLKER
ncbi:hypothetical protein Tco_0550514 [Tanacetum coccineum]